MAEQKIFVGRENELDQFRKVLEDPKGQAILVVGQSGMGKTWLVNKFCEIAEKHPDLKCGWVRYEVTPTDSVDSTMALMMDNAYDAAREQAGLLDKTQKRTERFRKFLNMFGNVGDFVYSFKRDPKRHIREQFLESLNRISEWMPENGRALFVIDPEKHMPKESDYSWGLVISNLPSKFKFLFPQRLTDVLVSGEGLARCDNIIRIPEGELETFDETTIEELVTAQSEKTPQLQEELRTGAKRSDKSPYAVTGTLELISEAGMKAEELAQYLSQEEVAHAQWRGICSKGEDAKRLFEAYAILEVSIPDDVVESVSGLKPAKRKRVMADKYLRGLLRKEGDGKRIYHAILSDYILEQIGEAEMKEYHGRAVELYREKLQRAKKEKTKPDELAATRLPEHVLATEGKEAFVETFINECYSPLTNLGLLDFAISLSERALKVVEKDSEEEAAILGNLGLIYQTKGEFDKSEQMHNKSLEIADKLGLQDVIASQYGNLGLIYQTLGELNKSEEMHNKALKIYKQMGNKQEMAMEYGNLGVVYQMNGEFDKAEQMHKKALEIAEKLGLQEIMAKQYGNLGLIYMDKGDLGKAEEMQKKSLDIKERLGLKVGMANSYGNLGNAYLIRGDLDKAKQMYRKVLNIEEKLGRPDSIANAYSNLGIVYKQRGDFEKARQYWEKALDLFKKIGMPHMVEKTEKLISELDKK